MPSKLRLIAAATACLAIPALASGPPAYASNPHAMRSCVGPRGPISVNSEDSCAGGREIFNRWLQSCPGQVRGGTGLCGFKDDGVGVGATARPNRRSCDQTVVQIGRQSFIAIAFTWQPAGPC